MFKLLRYFSIASFTAIVVAAILLAMFYRHIALRDLVKLEENKNINLTKAFSNIV